MVGREPELDDKELLREIALSPDPFVTATELADRLDMTRQNASYRLKSLKDDGYVHRREVGSRAVVYWLTEEGKSEVYKSD